MHEFSIIEQVLKTVEYVAAQNNLSKVTKIILQIGKLRQVMPDFLQFAFQAASADTIAKGATLEVKIIPIKIECLKCHHTFSPERHAYFCTQCSSHHIKVLKGKEILIESLEGDSSCKSK
jgi:hydrogenase nickel insertion protein HypA